MDVEQSQREPSTWATAFSPHSNVKHGYPPPPLSAGSVTTSYCGQPMIVGGELTDEPPEDTCPLCVLAWEARPKRPTRP